MTNTLQLPVLGLNAIWQVVDVYTGEKALGMIYGGTAVAINIDNGNLIPTKWDEWKYLPIGEGDDSIGTTQGRIRLPRVIIAVNYKQLKPRRMRLNIRSLARAFGYKCGYTGKHVPIKESSMDHMVPKQQGGKYEWENAVYTSKKLNNIKGARTPEEAGLKVKIKPRKIPVLLPSDKIIMDHGIRFKEWEMFLKNEEAGYSASS
jgi:hypothetical protein